jgi:hypothetical protein
MWIQTELAIAASFDFTLGGFTSAAAGDIDLVLGV